MAQRQFRDDDTDIWADRYGSGSDGALTVSANTTDATANTTISGTSGATAATFGSGTGFANGNLVLIHQSQGTGAGNWELNKISSGGGTTSVTLAYPLCNTYGAGAQVYLLKQYSSATINSGVTLTGQSWNGSHGGILAILCNGTISVAGNLSVNGVDSSSNLQGTGIGFRGGAGETGTGIQGESTTGIGSTATGANGMGGGGSQKTGGSSASAGGGGGGHSSSGGTAGNSGGTPSIGGTGGGTGGVANLTTMVFGGAGGGGGGNTGSSTRAGGSGAGLILLIGKTITITGGVTANGGSGGTISDPDNGVGGGGAGGSILTKGQTINLGSSLVTASLGAAGVNTFSGTPAAGAGSAGRIHADYSKSISGSTNPTIDTAVQKVLADQSGALFFQTY